MAKHCKVCDHPSLKEINTLLVEGTVSARSIADKFGLTYDSMHYHKTNHLPKQLAKGMERKQAKINDSLVQRSHEIEEIKIQDSFDILTKIDFIVKETEDIYNEVRGKGQNLLALKSLDSLRNHYQLLINLSAQLHANRMLELEQQRQNAGIDKEQANLKFEQDIKILTFEELKVMNRIIDKTINQTTEVIIENGKVVGWTPPFTYD